MSCNLTNNAALSALVIDGSSPAFEKAQNSFWNQIQREKAPECFFQPTEACQVAKAMLEVVKRNCPFAIKGGGHSSNPDGCSVNAGFQFDLANLNHVEIAEDRSSVRVGPGVRWGDLFKILEPHGVIAAGGRDYGVGVPGFIFGGGLSYLSTQEGWGIDNLLAVDIVLANGQQITVDKDCHPDLYRALHGGGAHNFGIVTNLTLKLHPYQGMWGGYYAVQEEHFDAVFRAYDKYTQRMTTNGKAHMIVDFFRRDGMMIAVHFMGYPEPLANPPIYDEICRIPSVGNTLRLAEYSNLAAEMQEVTDSRGKRNAYWTVCIGYNIDLLKSAYVAWAQITEPYAKRLRFAFDVNHITPAMRNKGADEGYENVYGLEGPNEPLTNILLTSTWEDKADDDEVVSVLERLGATIENLAREYGKFQSFRFMNYAHQRQDVITSFGEKNKAFLKEVAAKYDPNGVFQRLQVGGFNLQRWMIPLNASIRITLVGPQDMPLTYANPEGYQESKRCYLESALDHSDDISHCGEPRDYAKLLHAMKTRSFPKTRMTR
ncbi:FAD binding domain-containing protein [Aspergillus luchuensis]|uniref:FAD binding domain-containing protein n=1 Tax=Aspergillus kawachii TaxID=1069201 RepID=A0A146F319_ASPKA|nr:FAD binding domain-containing protein [Aspergillus luchuensis]